MAEYSYIATLGLLFGHADTRTQSVRYTPCTILTELTGGSSMQLAILHVPLFVNLLLPLVFSQSNAVATDQRIELIQASATGPQATHTGKQNEGGLSEGWGMVISAIITSVGVYITVKLTNRTSLQTFTSGVAREREKTILEFKTRQLNDLYGPLLLLLAQSKSLHERLRQERGGIEKQWALLDHMEACLGDPLCGRLVKEIVDIGLQIEQSLITKGGLIEGSHPPLSFERYLAHFRILKMSYDMKRNIRKNEQEYFPFPEFPDDLTRAYNQLQSQRAALLIGGSP